MAYCDDPGRKPPWLVHGPALNRARDGFVHLLFHLRFHVHSLSLSLLHVHTFGCVGSGMKICSSASRQRRRWKREEGEREGVRVQEGEEVGVEVGHTSPRAGSQASFTQWVKGLPVPGRPQTEAPSCFRGLGTNTQLHDHGPPPPLDLLLQV